MGREAAPARPGRSYVAPSVVTFFAYFLFWFPGAILNWYFLDDARRAEHAEGRAFPGVWALRFMMWLLVYLPLLTVSVLAVFGIFGALLVALLR